MNLRYLGPWPVLITMLLASLFASCSSSKPSSTNSTPKNLPDTLPGTTVPDSLRRLSDISDTKSIEYEIAAYEAATDLINLGKNALRGRDSGQALRLLTIGTRLMPWRGDVAQLRDTALLTYIEGTNSMITKGASHCPTIIDRIQYLSTIAPDGLSSLNDFNLACPSNRIQLKSKLVLEESDFISFLQKRLPDATPDKVEKSTDLSEQLEKIVARNKNFPTVDLLILGFNVFTHTHKKNRTLYDRFTIASNTVSENSFTLEVFRHKQEAPEIKDASVSEARRAYCTFLLEALGDNHKQMTWDELKHFIKQNKMDEKNEDDQGLVMCLSDKEVLADTTTTVLREKYYEFFLESARPSRIFALAYKPKRIISRRVVEHGAKSHVAYYLGTPPTEEKLKLNVDKQFVTGLTKLYYEIDFYNTYKMYRDVLTGKVNSFDDWWKAFPEEKTSDKIIN